MHGLENLIDSCIRLGLQIDKLIVEVVTVTLVPLSINFPNLCETCN